MRIICLIDSLGSGGAQRQMAYLAVLLKRAAHEVRVLTYHALDFFRPYVEGHGVDVRCYPNLPPLRRILVFRRVIRSAKPDAVIAFLRTPSLLSELAGLPRRRFRLIVSERSLDVNGLTWSVLRRFILHTLSDVVVANSHAQADFIRAKAPWLVRKTVTIVNCVDLHEFHPARRSLDENSSSRFLVMASVSKWKNPIALVQAFDQLGRRRQDVDWTLDWYGNKLFRNGKPAVYSAYEHAQAAVQTCGLGSRFRFHDPSPNAAELYRSADALILPSLFEGCPNVICEAFASGLPVLASRVGDLPRLVEDGVNGFLFDPHSPEDISRAIERFCDLPADKRVEMGRANRRKAETLFSFDRFLNEYQQLLFTGPRA